MTFQRSWRTRLIALAAAFTLAACASAPAPANPTPAAPAEKPPAPAAATPAKLPAKGAVDAVVLAQYRKWINEARVQYPYADSSDRMYAVMMCESRGQAKVINPYGPYLGLFQYASTTWKGAWNTYREQDILDAKAQVFATALAWKLKMQVQWGCYKKTG